MWSDLPYFLFYSVFHRFHLPPTLSSRPHQTTKKPCCRRVQVVRGIQQWSRSASVQKSPPDQTDSKGEF
ncbi:hypothetical protein E2C01_101190 [Portunus trituberculatus]|uniref:Uncharacterized protein n=1 Tax=Portunus trituberculatus TaxID=210409 RepID=A0A5B7KLB9_PORTR|nr:hypothetical protein [Portunus trituberculatus]